MKYIIINIVIAIVLNLADSSSFLKEGDHCDVKNAEYTCQNIKLCPLAAENIKNGYAPDICGLKQNNLVCCNKYVTKEKLNKKLELKNEKMIYKKKSITKRAAPGEKSKAMCEKYAESVFTYELPPVLIPGATKVKRDHCGIIESPLIVGGENAKPKEFPHMVLIGHSESDRKNSIVYWQCGGNLISDRWVLSAAHCTVTIRGLARWATLGDLKILSDDDKYYSKPVTIKIIERINYPDYVRRNSYHDIALYKLEKPVEFNEYIRPICLNTDDKPYTGKAIASGWGTTKWRGQASLDLQKVTLNMFDMTQCNDLYNKSTKPTLLAKIPKGITAENMVCAWEKGKDTCQGDSGGPLQTKLDKPYCMYSLIGITSFGDECATDLPGIYTRVSNYIPWIESKVWPETR